MTYPEALRVLARNHFVGAYFGPGYYSWTAVQEYMAMHPRGRGLPAGDELYAACRVYQAERSRSRSYRRVPSNEIESSTPGHGSAT